MSTVIEKLNKAQLKSKVVDVKSGDAVRVHQRIREGNKERVQVFAGLVIRTDNKNNPMSRITVRRIASGVGVEKSFLLHSPLIVKVEVTKRSKVRRNYLTYMRQRTGKSARLSGVEFDRDAVNAIPEETKEEVSEESAKSSDQSDSPVNTNTQEKAEKVVEKDESKSAK